MKCKYILAYHITFRNFTVQMKLRYTVICHAMSYHMSVYVIALIDFIVCHQIAIFKNKIDINVNINSEIINRIGIIKTSNQIHPHSKLFNK